MGATQHIFTVPYGMTKAAVEKMTGDMAYELRQHRVAVVALRPAFTRTETIMAAADRYDFTGSVPPEFNGTVVALLAADPELTGHTGQALQATELGRMYGIAAEDSDWPTAMPGRSATR